MNKIKFYINTILVCLSVFFIKIYQWIVSPDQSLLFGRLHGRICCHEPHCSEYAIHVLRRYGFIRGRFKAMDRISRCTGGSCIKYDPDHYRVVFFSSAPIGVPFLEALYADDMIDVVGVVTMPDAPAGRGQHLRPNIIKTRTQELIQHYRQTSICKILVLHGFANDDTSSRFPRAKNYFKDKGFDIQIPNLPHASEPNLQEQLDFVIAQYGQWIDDTTMIIGHSLGGLLAKQLVVALGKKIPKLLCIAPAFPDASVLKKYQDLVKKNPKYQIFLDKATYLDRYVNHNKVDENKLQKLVDKQILFASRDDEYIHFERLNAYYDDHFPATKKVIFDDKGHFNTRAKVTQLPEIEDILFDSEDMIQTPSKIHPHKSEEGKQWYDRLSKKKADYFVVIAYGKIIPQSILDLPRILPVNVHGSLLPAFRGASPIQSIFLIQQDAQQTQTDTKQMNNNELTTGITLIKMTKGMDEGPIIDTLTCTVPRAWTAVEVIEWMKENGPSFLLQALKHYPKGLLGLVAQDDRQVSYCSKFTKEDGQIDPWNDDIYDIYAKYRAFALWPKIYFFLPNGKRVVIEKMKIDERYKVNNNRDQNVVGWTLFSAVNDLHPAVQDMQLKPQGKKSMNWQSFVNGYLK